MVLRPFKLLLVAAFVATTLLAGVVGSNHPSSGAYAAVNAASWSSATWALGAGFTAGEGSTLQVGVYSAHATKMVLEIYTQATGAGATYDYDMKKGPDNVWRAAVAKVPGKTLYAFRAWGPNWPYSATWKRGCSGAGFLADCDASGNRFNPNKVLMDPYAREYSHCRDTQAMLNAGETAGMYATGGAAISTTQTYRGPVTGNLAIDARNVDTGRWAPKSVAFVDATGTGTKPKLALKDAVIYEAHLKGLTAHPTSVSLTSLLSGFSGFQDAANVPDALRGTYAGAAYMAGYLKNLGINTVEFLPVHESNNGLTPTAGPSTTSNANYWSYMTYGYFAPSRHYASNQSLGGPTAEFKQMVKAFHAAGLEVYLDVVYNHTAEGGLWDATTASAEVTTFRGLDNAAYYTLSGTANNFYFDSTGCGNNLNGGSSPVRKLVTDSLVYWASAMGIDGFRFDVAVELGRNGSSAFDRNAPILTDIVNVSKQVGFKIVAEPWDTLDGGEIGNFPAGWAQWNGNFRDALRRAMTGNLSGANGVGWADVFYGDYAHFNAVGGPSYSVNLLTAHDGFTMTDLVSYGSPMNATLAWPFGPSDGGSANNDSSNWGFDRTLRRQVIRSFWTLQALGRGVPMLVWGEEFGRTANGNNNAYNVDSVATWNNYAMLASASPDAVPTQDATGGTAVYHDNLGTFAGGRNQNVAFLQGLLQLRAAHPAFRQGDYTSMAVTFARPDGSSGFNQWTDAASRIAISGSQVGDSDFLFLVNLSGGSVTFTVPAAPAGMRWARRIDTNAWAEDQANCWTAASGTTIVGTYGVGNQSMVLLQAVPNP